MVEERPTCVAAMILYEAAELPRTESGDEIDALWQNPHRHTNYIEVGGQQHGGLFWFDYDGRCLQQSTSRVGAQVSMCCSRERIIGVDHIP